MRRRIDSACLSARADSALLDEAGGARQGTGVSAYHPQTVNRSAALRHGLATGCLLTAECSIIFG